MRNAIAVPGTRRLLDWARRTSAPRVSSARDVFDRLHSAVGTGGLITDPTASIAFASGLSEDAVMPPFAVAIPKTTAEVASIMRAASDEQLEVVVRGGASDLGQRPLGQSAGGATNRRLVISTAGMREVFSIDRASRTAHVAAGMTLSQLNRALAPHGLELYDGHAALEIATVGGTIANGASGAAGLGCGSLVTRLLGVTAVLPSGRAIRLGGAALELEGLPLHRLLASVTRVGGVICEAWLELAPAQTGRREITSRWKDWDEAINATRRATMQHPNVTTAVVTNVRADKPASKTSDAKAGNVIAIIAVAAAQDEVDDVASEVAETLSVDDEADVATEKHSALPGADGPLASLARAFYLSVRPGDSRLVLDLSVPPVLLGECLQVARTAFTEAGAQCSIFARSLEGYVQFAANWPQGEDHEKHANAVIDTLLRLADRHGGQLGVLHGRKLLASDLALQLAGRAPPSFESDVALALLDDRVADDEAFQRRWSESA